MTEIAYVICKNEKGNDNNIQPRQIGVDAINRASIERGDKLNVDNGDYVQVNCRKEYIHVWYIAKVAKKKNQSEARQAKNPKFRTII